jgi:hypothetical protein
MVYSFQTQSPETFSHFSVFCYFPKNELKNSTWYLSSNCFRSFFWKNWRHQKDISKLTDPLNVKLFLATGYAITALYFSSCGKRLTFKFQHLQEIQEGRFSAHLDRVWLNQLAASSKEVGFFYTFYNFIFL